MEAMSPQDVQAALDAFGLGLKVQFFDQSTATSQEAADAIGTTLGSIVKSLCFMVNGQPVVVLAAGDRRIDDRKLAACYEVSRKKVKTAKPDECVSILGYPPGSVPPLAYRTPDLPVFIEDSLSRFEQVYAAAGAPNAIFPLTFDQLCQITGGTVMDLQRD